MELTHEFTVSVPVEQAWAVLTDVERIAPCMPGAQLQEVEGDEYRGIVKVKVGPITAQYKGTASFEEKDDDGHRAVLKASGRDTRGQGTASATITATLEPAGEGTKVGVVTDLTVTGRVAQFGRGVLADVSGKLLDQFVSCLETDLLAGGGEALPEVEAAPVAAPAGEDGAATGPGTGGTGTGGGEPLAPAVSAPPGEPTGGAAPIVTIAPTTAEAPVEPEVATAEGGPATTAAPEAPPVGMSPAVAPAGTSAGAPSEVPTTGPRRIDAPEPTPVDLFGAAGAPVAKRVLPAVGALVVLLVVLRLVRRRR